VLSFGELKSRGEKARRIFRQLERVVRAHSILIEDYFKIVQSASNLIVVF
jgi:hypothetical protein